MSFTRYSNKDFIGEHETGREPKRFNSFEELNALTKGTKQSSVDEVDQRLFAKITEDTNVRWRFGIIQEKDGRIPKADGVPRMFIMGKGEDSHDTMMSLEDAGVQYGSKEFWRQSQLGNVFAYPAGETKPVQMRLELHGNAPNIITSKLIEPKDMPQPPRKQPGFFQRLLHRINKNWASEQTRDYYKTLNDGEAITKQCEEMEKVRKGSVKEEMEVLRDHENDLEIAQEKADFEKHVEDRIKNYDKKLDGHKTYRNMTAPHPVFDESIEKTPGNKGLYTKEGFKKLENIDANIADFKVGGKQISSDAYMGLVASCSLDPKNGENIFKSGSEYHPNLIDSLKPFGVTKEEFTGKYPFAHSDFVFGDFLDHDGLRDNEENQFESAINPGRKDAINLLKDYQNNVPGAKKKMAEAITRGIQTVSNITGQDKKDVSDQHLKTGRIMNAAADLLEKDPELKKLAMAKKPDGCGLKEEDLKAVKGLGVIDKADLAAAKAEKEIAESAKNNVRLTADEKKKLAVDVLTARMIKDKYEREIKLNLRDNKEYKEFGEKIHRIREDSIKSKLVAPPTPDRPLPPEEKLYFDQVTSLQNIKQVEMVHPPETALQLGAQGDKNYRKLAEHIVDANNMSEMNVSELDCALSGKEYTGSRLLNAATKAAQEIQEKNKPAQQKQAEAEMDDPELGGNLNINNELAKPLGPQL